jgi:hypothetical protein
MAESHVVSALTDKRAELLGLIQYHQANIQRLSISIDQLDATMLLFDADYDFKRAKSKGIRVTNPWFKQGEVPRLLLAMLGKSLEPISTTQLTDNLVQLKGIDVAGLKERDRLSKLVFGALKRMSDNKQVKCTGKIKGAGGGVMLWTLV